MWPCITHLAGQNDRAQLLDVRKRNVPISFYVNVEPNWRSACRLPNVFPNHHVRGRAPLTMSNSNRLRVVSSELPDTYATIELLKTQPGVIKKDDFAPFLHLLLSCEESEPPFLYVLHFQGKPK
ncbi:hypothetical protein TNCV_149151 [Trichonephila clavipes]|nr:hypothetical protein TNCV_149151 [Trichonephila clavipes]